VVGDGSEDEGSKHETSNMKKLFLAAVLVLPLLAVPARADGWCCPMHAEGGINANFSISAGRACGGVYQLAPWYNYWPLEAHFVTPAPTGYPFWPPPQAPMLAPNPLLPAPQPKPDGKTNAGPEVKPVGYSSPSYQSYPPTIIYGQAPSYWYSRP
jgi:hypothetical protein